MMGHFLNYNYIIINNNYYYYNYYNIISNVFCFCNVGQQLKKEKGILKNRLQDNHKTNSRMILSLMF